MGRDVSTAAAPIEREQELVAIDAVLDSVAAGSGRVLIVEGPPGIGKSRLLGETAARARDRGMEVLDARGTELEREFAWGIVLRLFEARLLRAPSAEREALLRGRAQLAGPLFTGDIAGSASTTTNEFALFHGLYWALINLGEISPVVLLVDDAHWADAISTQFLVYLALRVEDLPVAVVVGTRAPDSRSDTALDHFAEIAGASRMRPAELSIDGARALLADSGVPESILDERFVQASWEATRGTPFLLTEVAVAVRAQYAAGREIDPDTLGDFAPESVGRSVMMRLRRLGLEALAVARAAATLGDGTARTRLAVLAGLDMRSASDACDLLVEAHILTGEEELSFRHPMIRSAIKSELPLPVRRSQHTDAAALLHAEAAAPEEIAPHLLAGVPTDEDWARDVLHRAARSASSRGAPDSAVRFLRRAVEFGDPAALPPDLFIDLGYAEAASGETTALSRFEQAVRLLERPADTARALYGLGHTLNHYGRHLDAAEVFLRGHQMFEDGDTELARTFEASLIGASLFCAGNPTAAIRGQAMRRLPGLVDAVVARRPASAPERVLLAVSAVERLIRGGSAESANALARSVLLADARHPEDAAERMAMSIAMLALITGGHAEEAEHAAEELLTSARSSGDVLVFAEASALRAFAHFSLGRVSAAMLDAQSAVESTKQGWQALVPIPHAILARCLIERGELDEAGRVLDAVEPRLDGKATLHAFFHWARGSLCQELGRLDDALADYRLCAELFGSEDMRPSPAACLWRVGAALAAHAARDDAEARRLIDEELVLAEKYELPGHVGRAMHTKAVIVGGKDAEPLLREAVDRLRAVNMPLELARALLDAGDLVARRGSQEEGRALLREAMDLAHHCGATVLEERVRKALVRAGGRPRRNVVTGADALTPSERRIAELVASGMSNRQIAETLFIAKTTVEWHLRRVYGKLAVSSRHDLSGALASR